MAEFKFVRNGVVSIGGVRLNSVRDAARLRAVSNREQSSIAQTIQTLLLYALDDYEMDNPITEEELQLASMGLEAIPLGRPAGRAKVVQDSDAVESETIEEYDSIEEAMKALEKEEE